MWFYLISIKEELIIAIIATANNSSDNNVDFIFECPQHK